MTEEQRFTAEDLVRVNIELDTRNLRASWSDTSEIIVRGDAIDALVQADELYITSESGRRHESGMVEVELPARPLQCAIKVERGDIQLTNAQDRVQVESNSGDVKVNRGSGLIQIALGRGDVKVDEFNGEVIVNSGSGDTSLRGIAGDVTLRSGKGDAHLAGGDGRTTIASASGDIHINDRHCQELTLAGASGDITVAGGSLGRTSISSASGDIHCQSALTIANYEITASSGDISLAVPRDLPVRVDAATTRGSISTDLPLVAIAQRGPRNPRGKRLVGSTGETADRADITLRTSSGDVSVHWSAASTSNVHRSRERQPGFGLEVTPSGIAIRKSDRSVELSTKGISVRDPNRDIQLSWNSDDESAAASEPEDITDKPQPDTITIQNSTADVLPPDDRKRAILSALADGSISTEEASMLLDALDRAPSGQNGA